MHVLIVILLVIACFIALLLIVSAVMTKEHYVKREIVIDVPAIKVFDYVKFVKNQDSFNEGAMADQDRKKTFNGTDGTVGFIYSWSGNKDAGVGEKEIMKIIEGKSIELEIRFLKPMKTSARILIETQALTDNQTKASWSNRGTLNYPLNIMIPMLQKHVVKDLDTSLSTLKNILEK